MPDVIFEVIEEGSTVDVITENPVVDVGVLDTVVSVITVEGPSGPRGLPGTGVPIVGQLLTGTINGSNMVFTTASAYQANSTSVYLNGIREPRGIGYIESGISQITFTSAPIPGDDIRIDYVVT